MTFRKNLFAPALFCLVAFAISLADTTKTASKEPTAAEISTFKAAFSDAAALLAKETKLGEDLKAATTAVGKLVKPDAAFAADNKKVSALTAALAPVSDGKLADTIKELIAKIATAKLALDNAYKPFKTKKMPSAPDDELKKALEATPKTSVALATQAKALPKAGGPIALSCAKVPGALTAYVGLLGSGIQKLEQIDAKDGDDTLLNPNSDLDSVTAVLTLRSELETKNLEELQKALDAVSNTKIDAKALLLQIKKLDARLAALSDRTPDWLAGIQVEIGNNQIDSTNLLNQLINEPSVYGVPATAQANLNTKRKSFYTKVGGQFDTYIKKISDPATPKTCIGKRAAECVRALTLMRVAADRLDLTSVELLKSDRDVNITQWTSDQISLFYFDDVPRLMQFLRGEGAKEYRNDSSLQELSKNARTAEVTADLNVGQAQGNLSQARAALDEAKQRLQEAADKQAADRDTRGTTKTGRRQTVAEAKASVYKAQEQVDVAQAAATAATEDYTIAQKEYDAEGAIKSKAATIKRNETLEAKHKAEADLAQAQAVLKTKTAELADLQGNTTADQTGDDTVTSDLKAEVTALQTKYDAALTARDTAAAAVVSARISSRVAAQLASTTFANARDNAPFWAALPELPIGKSTDPLKRVMLYGSPDSRTIFIRGSADDIDRVKEMIAKIDVPMAQAMMTVYTVEIGALASRKGIEDASAAMKKVDAMVSQHSRDIQAKTNLLKDAIDDAFRSVEPDEQVEISKLKQLYHGDILAIFTGRDAKNESGLKDSLVGLLPRPYHPGSLAEAIVMLSLASDDLRNTALNKLWPTRPVAMTQGSPPGLVPRQLVTGEQAAAPPSGTASRFELYMKSSSSLGSLRDGVIRELKYRVSDSLWEFLRAQLKQFREIYKDSKPTKKGEVGQNLSLVDLYASTRPDADAKQDMTALRAQSIGNLKPYMILLLEMYGSDLKSAQTVVDEMLKNSSSWGTDALDRLEATLNRLRSYRPAHWFETRHALLAKVNESLKEAIRSFDDDVRAEITGPAVDRLERDLRATKLSVGIFQKTSILASNRLIARVDPQGSAELELGETKNALQDAMQLAQIYNASKNATFGSALGDLTKLKEEKQPPAIYGINTGNLFQVTPIFDPSGQALRFRFDYISATQVKEPNGSISALPRIERHSINTEVQLSNYEIRNVSQFNSNSQVGLPTRKSGGLPVLKDLYPFSEIPLIGWFTRREGRNATIQESVILTETSMYPTISDIIELLSPQLTGAEVVGTSTSATGQTGGK